MLKYYITEGAVKEGRVRKTKLHSDLSFHYVSVFQIHFLVECPSGEAYRDSCDMAPDVTEIALKQVKDC